MRRSAPRAQLTFGQKLDIAKRLDAKEDPKALAAEFGCSVQSVFKARKEEAKNKAVVARWGNGRELTREPTHMWVFTGHKTPKTKSKPKVSATARLTGVVKPKPKAPEASATSSMKTVGVATEARGPAAAAPPLSTSTGSRKETPATRDSGPATGGVQDGNQQGLLANLRSVVDWADDQPSYIQDAAETLYTYYCTQGK